MSQTNSPKLLLAFKARTDDKAGAEALEVTVKNDSGAAWADVLIIELQLPAGLVTEPVNKASQAAPKSRKPPNMARLAGVVTVPAGWTVWAFNKGDEHVVVLRVFNSDLSQQTGAPVGTPTRLDADAAITLRVPLKPEALRAEVIIPYGYQSATGDETRADGKLELRSSLLPDFKPKVSLTVSQRNPTMIKPGTEVVISWSVENGVAATLRGPLPAGNSEWELSPDPKSKFSIQEGSFTTVAVGPATYILDAEVKNPAGGPNVQVIRTLTLDIYSADQYANLIVRPDRVLPHGPVEIDWAVWGVQKAAVWVSNRSYVDLELTEQNLFRTFQGTGTWAVHATANQGAETVSLSVTNAPNIKGATKQTIDTVTWMKIEKKPSYGGAPLGMAFVEETGTLALLTTDGLYTAGVGRDDKQTKDPVFVKAQAEAKAWRRITALESGFVVLKQTADDDLVVQRYDTKGQRVKSPVTLPGDFKTMLKVPMHGRFFNLVALESRVYVVAGGTAPNGGEVRRACSVSFDPDTVRAEPALAGLHHYRLLSFDDAIYAYERHSGRMLRFDRAADGTLEPPRRAAAAVNEQGESMIKTGTLVPVGTVLAVLNPAALPSFKPFALLGLENVLHAAMRALTQTRNPDEIPQDLVYNPQTNHWTRCGRGLEAEVGAVAAFRGGASKRLWVLQPGKGEMHTLAGAKEELFASDYVDDLHTLDLKPALDATREFTLTNQTVLELVPPDEALGAAGLEGFSADGPAELSTPVAPLPNTKQQAFKFSYDSANTTNVKLRLMVAAPPGLRYFLEVTLSGAGLGNVTSVFKRLSPDGRVDEIPNTSQQYAAGARDIAVNVPRALHKTPRLLLLNGTTRDELAISPAVGPDKIHEWEAVDFSYKTPDFKVSMIGSEKAGHLWVSFDYAMPLGIEVSSRREPQRQLIRVSADDPNMLDASVGHLDAYSTIDFTFDRYDGRRSGRNRYTSTDAFWCRVGMRKKFELDGVRLGDAVSLKDMPALYLPMAKPDDTSQPRVYRFSLENGEVTSLATNPSYPTRGGVFSVPNAVALDDREVYAMFAEPVLNRTMHDGTIPWSRNNTDHYKEIVALAATPLPKRAAFMLGSKKSGAWQAQPGRYFVLADREPNDVFEIPFDNVNFGTAHGSLAASPDGKLVAICHKGGFIVVDLTSRNVVPVNIANARDPAHIVFSPDGQWVYCAHATRAITMNPRRAEDGFDITVTRARVANLSERQTVALPDVRGTFHLTADTRETTPTERPKEEVALSLAPSPDGASLFVSAGTTIMKIALSNFTLQPWRATVELPCRLACVKEGWGEAWTLYALGSYYKGDGTKVGEYKTHLYAIPAPKN